MDLLLLGKQQLMDRLEDKSKINSTIRKTLCTRARCTHTHALMCRGTDRSSPRDFDAHWTERLHCCTGWLLHSLLCKRGNTATKGMLGLSLNGHLARGWPCLGQVVITVNWYSRNIIRSTWHCMSTETSLELFSICLQTPYLRVPNCQTFRLHLFLQTCSILPSLLVVER